MKFFFCIPGKVWIKGGIMKAIGIVFILGAAVGMYTGYKVSEAVSEKEEDKQS